MDSYEELMKREEARELDDWKRRKATQEQYESVAKQAHKIRMTGRLLLNSPCPCWEDLNLSSQRHLIADAANVAMNPSISGAELNKLYQERLVASGETDSPDLNVPEESFQALEETILKNLKAALSSFPAGSTVASNPPASDA